MIESVKKVLTTGSYYSGGEAVVGQKSRFLYFQFEGGIKIIEPSTGILIGNVRFGMDSTIDEGDEGVDEIIIFAIHEEKIEGIIGTRIFGACKSKCIRIADCTFAPSFQCRKLSRTMAGHNAYCVTMESSLHLQDIGRYRGNLLLTGSRDRTIRLWDAHYLDHLHTFSGHHDSVTFVKFIPDESVDRPRRFCSASDDLEIRIWDIDKKICEHVLKDHQASITGLTFGGGTNDACTVLISSSEDQVINLWVIDDTMPKLVSKPSRCILLKEPVYSLVLDRASKFLYFLTRKSLRVIDPLSEDILSEVILSKNNVDFLRLTLLLKEDGGVEQFFAFSELGDICIIRPLPKEFKKEQLESINKKIHSLKIDEYMRGYIGDVTDAKLIDYHMTDNMSHTKVEARFLVAVNDTVPRILTTSFPLSDLTKDINQSNNNNSHYSVKWEDMFSQNNGNTIRNDSPTEKGVHTGNISSLSSTKLEIGNLNISVLAMGSRDGTTSIWIERITSPSFTLSTPHDIPSLHSPFVHLVTLDGHGKPVTGSILAFGTNTPYYKKSKDFMSIVTCYHDGSLKRWDLKDKVPTLSDYSSHYTFNNVLVKYANASVLSHKKAVNTLALSPNGKLVVTGSHDRSINIWRLSDLVLITTCSGHKRAVWAVCFSLVDRLVASGSADATIRIWQCPRLKQGSDISIDTAAPCIHTMESDASVLNIKFCLPLCLQIVSIHCDSSMRIWDRLTGSCVLVTNLGIGITWALEVINGSDSLISAPENKEFPVSIKLPSCFFVGSSDGNVSILLDSTDETRYAVQQRRQRDAEVDLTMEIVSKEGNYRDAMKLALSRNRIGIFRKLLDDTSWNNLEQSFKKRRKYLDSSSNKERVEVLDVQMDKCIINYEEINQVNTREFVRSLDIKELETLLTAVESWCRTPRFSQLGIRFLHSVLMEYSIRDVVSQHSGIRNILKNIQISVNKHSKRLVGLCTKVFSIDALLCMSSSVLNCETDLGVDTEMGSFN